MNGEKLTGVASGYANDLYMSLQSAKRLLKELKRSRTMLAAGDKCRVQLLCGGEELTLTGHGVHIPSLEEYLENQIRWVESQVAGMEKLVADAEKAMTKIHERLPEVLG